MLRATSLSPTVDPMAARMAQLLAESDLDELREVVKRWIAESPTRRTYENDTAQRQQTSRRTLRRK